MSASESEFFLALLDVNVQGVQVLNDAVGLAVRAACLHATFVVITVRTLLICCIDELGLLPLYIGSIFYQKSTTSTALRCLPWHNSLFLIFTLEVVATLDQCMSCCSILCQVLGR